MVVGYSRTHPANLLADPSPAVHDRIRDARLTRDPTEKGGKRLTTHEEWELVSVVAHEMRGPLAALVMSSELMVGDIEVLSPEELRQMATRIHRGAIWLQGLFENLLTAATLDRDNLDLQPERIQLTDIIREVHLLLGPLLAHRDQRLRVRVSGHHFEVWADTRRMTQVLINLLLNAAKYSGPDTAIDILLTAHRRHVRIAVSDRGPGVAPGLAEQLFDPYFRAPQAAAGGSEGLGLGLAIVRGIVEAHGGKVGVVNRRGGGARFWCDLPLLEPNSSQPARQPQVDDLSEKKEASIQ